MKTVLFLIVLIVSSSADTLVISFGSKPDTWPYELSQRYIDEINSRLDSTLQLQLIFQPFGRSALNLCEGKGDADFMRTEYVYTSCSKVVKVPVALRTDRIFTFCSKEYLNSISNHPDSTTRYVTTLGNRVILYWKEANNIPCHEVLDYRQALKMIHLGRADCFLGSDAYKGDSLISDYNLLMGEKPIIEANNYIYLHRKHEKHVGQLTRVLYQMNQEDFMGRLLRGEVK